MRVVAIRHAKSDYPIGTSDHDRPLAQRGVREAPAIGRWLEEAFTWQGATPVDLVSSAKRTRQTWSLAAEQLSPRWQDIVVVEAPEAYEASVQTLRELIARQHAPNIVIVAHNPGLQSLVCAAHPSPARDAAIIKFPTSAISLLEARDEVAWLAGDYNCLDYVVARP